MILQVLQVKISNLKHTIKTHERLLFFLYTYTGISFLDAALHRTFCRHLYMIVIHVNTKQNSVLKVSVSGTSQSTITIIDDLA